MYFYLKGPEGIAHLGAGNTADDLLLDCFDGGDTALLLAGSLINWVETTVWGHSSTGGAVTKTI